MTLRALADPLGLRIGTAVNTELLDDPAYAGLVAEQFSGVTAENAMKWVRLEPERGAYDWAPADRLVAFAEANGQTVRGHTLVWHNQVPGWLQDAAPGMSADALRDILRSHVHEVAGRYSGRVREWDVVNEAVDDDGGLRDSLWLRALGPGFIADAFRWAHEADPDALLFYNDYSIEDDTPKTRAVHELVAGLRAEGVPVHGVGLQTHLAVQHGFPDLVGTLGRFAAAGLRLALTEVDVRAPLPVSDEDRARQVTSYARTLEAALGVCDSYTVWGVSDAESWIPGTFPGEGDACLWDASLAPKPQYAAVEGALARTLTR